ncbi:CNH domain-containing protein [Zychaea mexicana]|uniref:CNH domain-containing protein n=1 Tax=Zychaea mexicana TaxID=64656 RepID=UPI0022FDDD2E|nr:CNH domain-containing protein [Zychaea mexicana]KAI9499680.1 CNH domain-containing protein [Zychaea mexicana]
MMQLPNIAIRRQKSAAQLRPSTPRRRRISGPFIVGGFLGAQNSPSPPQAAPSETPAIVRSVALVESSSSSNGTTSTSPPPPSALEDHFANDDDYISAYRPSPQILVDYARSTSGTPLYDEQEDYLVPIDSANCSLLSVVSEAFVRKLGSQEIFTGEEAANALHGLLSVAYYPEYQCIQVANALMHCKPNVLFQPLEDYGNPPRSDVSFSAAWDQKYLLRYDALEEETKPVAVLSNLTPCYVGGCEPGNTSCYAPRCPNNPGNAMKNILHIDQSASGPSAVRSMLHDNVRIDVDSSITLGGGGSEQDMTRYNPHDSISSNEEEISVREAARQHAIIELIRSHRSLCQSLDILHHVIVASILSADDLGTPERRTTLVSNVFGTYNTLREMSRALLNDMQLRRSENERNKIPMIGDILYQHLKLMWDPLIAYISNIPLTEYIIEHEKVTNRHFADILERVKRDKWIVKSGVTAIHYIYLAPRMQLPRYLACLREIIGYTHPHHRDIDYLKRCKDIIERIELESNKRSKSGPQRRVEVLRLADALRVPQHLNLNMDLNLAAPQRRLLYQSTLKRSGKIRKKTVNVFILDHMILTTTTTQRDTKHEIWDRPILLPMLHVPESKTNWVTRPSSGSSVSSGGGGGGGGGTTRRSRMPLLHNSSQEDISPTITLKHLGRSTQKERKFACAPDEKRRCLAAIDDARKLYKQNKKDVFRLTVLNRTAFRVYHTSPSRNDEVCGYDKVNCSVPLGTDDRMIAVGTNSGVYLIHKDSSAADLMLPNIGKVTQMAIMSKANLLLVLTAVHELRAYTIETIIDVSRVRNGQSSAQSICVDHSVQFFQVGSTERHQDLLIYKKRRHGESVVVAVKPIDEVYHAATRDRVLLMSPQYFSNRHVVDYTNYIFRRVHQDNIRGKGVHGIQFCGEGNVALVCLNNIRFLSFDDGEPYERRSSLSLNDRRRRDEDNTEARAAFHLSPTCVLLCYNRYGYLIDAHGNPVSSSNGQAYLFEWESEPLRVVRHRNHIIGFSEHFIEIRHLSSGELVQIVPADLCQLTFEGLVDGEPVIHGCMVEAHSLDRQQLFQLELHRR